MLREARPPVKTSPTALISGLFVYIIIIMGQMEPKA